MMLDQKLVQLVQKENQKVGIMDTFYQIIHCWNQNGTGVIRLDQMDEGMENKAVYVPERKQRKPAVYAVITRQAMV